MTDIPHLIFPLRRAGNRMVVAEQNDPAEIKACVINIVRTPVGFSDEEELRGMGLAQQIFRRGGPDLAEIERQIETYEPRVDALVDGGDPADLNDAFREIGVQIANPGGFGD